MDKDSKISVTKKVENIKALLNDFSPLQPFTLKDEGKYKLLLYEKIPLNPVLFFYCFDLVGISHSKTNEKLNFIRFSYKNKICCLIYDFENFFGILVPEKHESEFIKCLENLKVEIDKLLSFEADIALDTNDYLLPNNFRYYNEKLCLLNKKIIEFNGFIEALYDDIMQMICNSEPGTKISHEIDGKEKLKENYEAEMGYMIESYIETFYSFLEHITVLLIPFAPGFDPNVSYYKKYISNGKWGLKERFDVLFNSDLSFQNIINTIELYKTKEIFRNSVVHGFFSREMRISLPLDKAGICPVWVGRKYLSGILKNLNNIILTFTKYKEIRSGFLLLINYIKEKYEVPMVFISSGIDIPVNTTQLCKDVYSADDAMKKVQMIKSVLPSFKVIW